MARRTLRLVAAVLCVIWLLAPAAEARAHAILVTSQPQQNAELAGSEVDFRLEFNSRIDAARSSLQLAKDGGQPQPLALGESTAPNLLVARVQELAPGDYRLRWQVLSVDGHVSRGDLNFRVRTP
jgi:methionine-rich copper-binding protein CopC